MTNLDIAMLALIGAVFWIGFLLAREVYRPAEQPRDERGRWVKR